MKLLLDENLSRRIVPFLQADFPGSSQVVLSGLESASDSEIWQYAKANGFVIFRSVHWLQGIRRKLSGSRSPTAPKRLYSILLEHHVEIEQALIGQNRACVEISSRNK